jgi:hypothetical protein
MTLFELLLLLTTTGLSGIGFAALCGALLERIGRQAATQPVRVTSPRR